MAACSRVGGADSIWITAAEGRVEARMADMGVDDEEAEDDATEMDERAVWGRLLTLLREAERE
jgi:hypothetical protein